jgi:hypothetical protein
MLSRSYRILNLLRKVKKGPFLGKNVTNKNPKAPSNFVHKNFEKH